MSSCRKNLLQQHNNINICKITAKPRVLFLERLGFQLRHASLGAAPKPPSATLGAGLKPNMVVENVIEPR